MTPSSILFARMRETTPLVQCITNYVAMNIAANVLLAAGASPAMVHAEEEAGEFVSAADALTINIGTPSPSWIGGMKAAAAAARKAGKCRFIGFTGHRDPDVHLEMLRRYHKYDTIIMPLNPADPHYLSFEKKVLPVAVERGMGIQAIKATANAGLLPAMHVRDCLSYVLTLPVHTVPLGCTTVGQIEDDARIAREFKPISAEQAEKLRGSAKRLAGPRLENWKRDNQQASAERYWDGGVAPAFRG